MNDTDKKTLTLVDEICEVLTKTKSISAERFMHWSGRLRSLPEGEIGPTSMAICQLATYQAEHNESALAEQLFDLAMSASSELAKETVGLQAQEASTGDHARRQLLGGAEKKRAPQLGEAAPAGSIQVGGLSPRRA